MLLFYKLVQETQMSTPLEATEFIEAAEVLRPGKLLLRTLESCRHLNSALFFTFRKKFFG